MKIFTLGSGFIAEHLNYPSIDAQVLKFDFSSNQIERILYDHDPDVIINCLGITGRPTIDECESKKENTALVNTALPIMLANECAKKSIHLIQIGSGCVFNGQSPHDIGRTNSIGWKETDIPNPVSYYSRTKAACDLVLGPMKNTTVLRIRMPISTLDHPRNLINKLKGYQQIIDIQNSMTFMKDLVDCVDWAAKGSHTGIFHVVNPEPLTAVDIMTEYQKYVPDHKFEIISGKELDRLTVAKRSNCILNGYKLKDAGFKMTSSKEALEDTMKGYFDK